MTTGKINGVGIDIVDVKRFHKLLDKKKHHLLAKLFSPTEQKYCFSYKDAAPHFAGTFAAKEAAKKAKGDASIPVEAFEVHRQKEGKPEIWLKGRRVKSLLISISHTDSMACAVAYNTQP